MENLRLCGSASVLFMTILLCLLSVSAQPGFLSIDCGGNTNYTDTGNNIRWVTDVNYILHGAGQTASISIPLSNSAAWTTLRFFPKPLDKSCYQLPVIPDVPYLLRMSFLFGNYSRKQELPVFKVSSETAGSLFAFDISFEDPNKPKKIEQILMSSNDILYICLIRTSVVHDPFISSIELRALLVGMYKRVRPGTALNTDKRLDFGGNPSNPIRYPQDRFDRTWFSEKQVNLSFDPRFTKDAFSTLPVSTEGTKPDLPPPAVMQTAMIVRRNSPGLTMHLYPSGPNYSVGSLLLLYFSEIEILRTSESRIFDINLTTDTSQNVGYSRVPSPEANISSLEKQFLVEFKSVGITFTLTPTDSSSLGPIINALEWYEVLRTDPETSPQDVEALAPIRRMFDMKEWIADPCHVVYWNGITCDPSASPVRVSQLNLSRRNLTGRIPSSIGRLTGLRNLSLDSNHLTGDLPDLSNLTKLEKLHLQNNNFSGNLPLWLSHLTNLKELSIDNNHLKGDLPDLSKLTKLEKLHLQNNSFSGDLPPWLYQLTNLKELYLNGNNFSGTVPEKLLYKYRSLDLIIFPGNPHLECTVKNILLCNSNSSASKSNKEKVKIVTGATTGAILIIAISLIITFIAYRKKFWRKEHANKDRSRTVLGILGEEDYSMVKVPNPSKSRAFTLDEMMIATQNFSQKIGQGGFGSVFFGKLQDGKDVAVKVLSLFSKQGVVEFLNEVDLLSRVNHKNLVSLLGYCNESRELMLIYEYMSAGSLKDHLYGSATDLCNLDWKTRLKIALDAAQGLEYLHVNCTPKIIHRDVKTANILLDSNLTGKLSDFGLSRMTFDEMASHVTTTVKGTAGYLDPEYFNTHMLTEKSDVYSFGVVLLEIVCGRQPIDIKLSEDQLNLIRWVTPYVEAEEDPGKLAEIVDKRLNSDYDMKCVSHVAKLSIRCVQNDPSLRPTISEIVAEIKEAMRFQPDIAAAFVAEEIERDFEDLQASTVSNSLDLDSSMPKEFDSSDSSHNIFRKEFNSSDSSYNII